MPLCSRIARWRAATFAAVALGANAGFATASPSCGAAGRPWVSITFAQDHFTESFKVEALQDLKAGLNNRNIETCAEGQGPTTPPVAAIVISSSGDDNVKVTVEIRDAVTEKRVSRDLDLASMPADGRALATAVAADELVWASWAEIAYTGTKRRSTAPREVVTAVERAVHPPPPVPVGSTSVRSGRVGLQFAAEHFGAKLTDFGVDGILVLSLAERVGLKIAAGGRQGLVITAPDGRVQSTAMTLAVDGRALLFRGAHAELAWSLGPRAAWVHIQGEAAASAHAASINGLAVLLRTGPNAGFRLGGPLWLEFGAGIGVPLRAVEANDEGTRVTGMAGLEQSTTLSLEGEL